MSEGRTTPVDRTVARDRRSALVGLVIVRGGGAPVVQRRLPGKVPVTVGRRDRNGFALTPDWVPMELARLTPVEEGWLLTNGARTPMSVASEWIRTGSAAFNPHATVMLQRGEHRVSWPELQSPVALSVAVRTRRAEDRRIPYAVDGAVDVRTHSVVFGQGPQTPPMSDAVRYRLAVLFEHLLAGGPAPLHPLRSAADLLGISEEELGETAQRYRRRLNAARGLDLQTLEELGEYLVTIPDGLTGSDTDP